MDTSYAANDESYQTPDSNPWGVGGVPDQPVVAKGTPEATEAGFYDTRDDIAGGSDTQWNMADGSLSGANWASDGDTAPVFNSSSGLGGERARFTGTLSQESLAGGENTGNFSPV